MNLNMPSRISVVKYVRRNRRPSELRKGRIDFPTLPSHGEPPRKTMPSCWFATAVANHVIPNECEESQRCAWIILWHVRINRWVAFPFCHITLRAKRRPQKPRQVLPRLTYPRKPKTLGEHLRKKIIDLGISRDACAKEIGVRPATISNWQNGRVIPAVDQIPSIIKFWAIILLTAALKICGRSWLPFATPWV